jgi:hypothetical protein
MRSGSLLLLHTIQCHGTSSRKWLVVTGIGTVALKLNAQKEISSIQNQHRMRRRIDSKSTSFKEVTLACAAATEDHHFHAVKCPTNSKGRRLERPRMMHCIKCTLGGWHDRRHRRERNFRNQLNRGGEGLRRWMVLIVMPPQQTPCPDNAIPAPLPQPCPGLAAEVIRHAAVFTMERTSWFPNADECGSMPT